MLDSVSDNLSEVHLPIGAGSEVLLDDPLVHRQVRLPAALSERLLPKLPYV